MAAKCEKPTFLIVTAGQSRKGKSTAMNNVLGANFDAKCSAYSVTKTKSVRRVEMKESRFIVVDTPGLASLDIKYDKIAKDVSPSINDLNFVLVYCQPVGPDSSHSVADEQALKNLQHLLGQNVWKQCVVLFTFSDFLRKQEFPEESQREDYKNVLRDHATRLSKTLHKVYGEDIPDVKMLFDVNTDQKGDSDSSKSSQDGQENDKSTAKSRLEEDSFIVAVPVGKEYKNKKESHLLLPDMENSNWKQYALEQILRKAEPLDPEVIYFSEEDGTTAVVSSIIAAFACAAVGGSVGAAVGATAFGFGAIPGAIVGAGAGAITAAVGGGTAIGTSVVIVGDIHQWRAKRKIKNKKKKIDKLEEAERIRFEPNYEKNAELSRHEKNDEPNTKSQTDAENPDID